MLAKYSPFKDMSVFCCKQVIIYEFYDVHFVKGICLLYVCKRGGIRTLETSKVLPWDMAFKIQNSVKGEQVKDALLFRSFSEGLWLY